MLPMQDTAAAIESLDQAGRAAHNPLERPLEEYLRERYYVDVAVRTPSALACAIATYGLGHVLFAIDFPFVDPVGHVEFLRSSFAEDELNTIMNENRMPFPAWQIERAPGAAS
jgi:hypothetical protein